MLELWNSARTLPPSIPDTAEAVKEALPSLLVADDGGRVVGTLMAAWDGWRGNMYRLAVAPERRREGIATALVRAGEELLVSRGARRVSAVVWAGEEHADALWKGTGYVHDERANRYVRNF